jgi:hypothetical protein
MQEGRGRQEDAREARAQPDGDAKPLGINLCHYLIAPRNKGRKRSSWIEAALILTRIALPEFQKR